MRKKKATSVLALVMLVSIAGYFYLSNPKSTLNKKASGFNLKDTSQVSQIELKHKNQHLILERKENDWLINNQAEAKTASVKYLLNALSRIQTKAPVPKIYRQKMVDKLNEEGVKISVKRNKNEMLSFLVYHDTEYDLGTVMIKEKTNMPFMTYIPQLEVPLASLFIYKETFWQKNVVFQLSPNLIQVIDIEYPTDPIMSFRIEKSMGQEPKILDNNDMVLEGIDREKISSYLQRFSLVKYQAVVDDEELKRADSIFAKQAMAILRIKSVEANHEIYLYNRYEMKNGQIKPDYDRLYAFIKNKQQTVLVSFIDFAVLLKEPAYFVQK